MKSLYRQEAFPIFQNRMYESAEAARTCPKGDIDLVEDQKTGLVYNRTFRPELLDYDGNYQNEQGLSAVFQRHLENVLGVVGKHLGHEKLVEVGCGKGHFLEMLVAKGFDITGFDPAYEGNSERVQRKYFGSDVIHDAHGLILRHVLEHIKDPVAFLKQLKEANGGSGRIYIEVPCFDWICVQRAWFDIFYEHVNYFRLSDFDRMFGQVVESGRLFGGQYLYVVAELATVRDPQIDTNDRVQFPHDFTANVVEQNKVANDTTAIWGGASKGVIFSLLKQRAGQPVSVVIDINPAKQGKYLPGTGLPVSPPATALARLPKGATIYVMNPNYLNEIREMSNHEYNLVAISQ